MAKEQKLPQAWSEIETLKNGKLDKSGGIIDGDTIIKGTGNTLAFEPDNGISTIDFRCTGTNNDRGWIKHYNASTNHAKMEFCVSDDPTTGEDSFSFGAATGNMSNINATMTEWMKINSDNIYYKNNAVYHTGNKPTATDIGAVNKTGDTFSGRLTMLHGSSQFQGTRNSGATDINLNNRMSTTEMDWSYTGTAVFSSITNGFPMTNNANGLLSFNTHGGQYGHQIGMSSNGSLYVRNNSAGAWTSWRTIFDDLNSPIVKAQNGYFRLGNGLIVQWGNLINGDGTRTITLPIAFSNNTYTISHSLNYSDDTGISTVWTNNATITGSKTTTNFTVGTGVTTRILGVAWIAIGY